MRGRNRRPPASEAGGEIVETALLACVVAALLAGTVAFVSVVRTIDIAPKVGDILVFRRDARLPSDWQFSAARTSDSPAQSCVLRPDIMGSGGGSLVVEQRSNDSRLYRVHWAGGRTSEGASDCGSTADFALPRADLQLLTNAVGGPGVEHKAFPGF